MRIESGSGHNHQPAAAGPTFTGDETALRVSLATALIAIGERDDASRHTGHNARLTDTEDIGSTRREAASLLSHRPVRRPSHCEP